MRYIPALDGLRAVAIAIVMAHHVERPLVPAGWMGVDVFFVLSGFLITSILLVEIRQEGKIKLGNFYIRRFLRLSPPFLIVIAFELARSLFSADGHEIREATLISALYIENWNAAFQFGPHDVLGHTWSLAVEEQFYWLWPLLLPLIFRKRPLIWLGGAIVAMTAIRVGMWRAGFALDGLVRFFPLERPVGLVIGCALAFLPINDWKLQSLAGLASLAFLIAVAVFAAHWPVLDISAPLFVSLATAVLIVCVQRPSAVTSALSTSSVRYVGKISYGLYLYHYPIFRLGEGWNFHAPFHLYAVSLLALSLAAAALSYEFVEKPILSLKSRFASVGRSSAADRQDSPTGASAELDKGPLVQPT
jgi:peptidoglycan/LPS O-acetylase OafA/YrhL